jgi:deazaflavin-dependent oxidoreductase (nitroreductase family)
MLDTPNFAPGQMQTLRRVFHAMNYFMVFMWQIGMGRVLNGWPAVTGCIMLIQHRGRKTGKQYRTPVNYAIVENEIYCAAGFGAKTDWYRNILAGAGVQLWLPQGRRRAHATDVSASPQRVLLLREIIIASGLAGPLLGVDQRKLNDQQIGTIGKDYRLVHFELEP